MASQLSTSGTVLLSWIAKRNDPYQQVGEQRVLGPTLGLLFDESSPYRGEIQDVVLFARDGTDEPRPRERTELQILDFLSREIQERDSGITVHKCIWPGEDPTDYEAIHSFLREKIPALREQFGAREWLIHISPGTPAMQTIWVLMVETGQIPGPVTMVKSVRPWERKDGKLAVPVRLDLDTLFKSIQAARPVEVAEEADQVFWNPARFKSEALKRLYNDARRIARLNVPVLILGERGTGKTTLASWIRANSPFRRKELDEGWPSIACGAYSAETMRSELLGHEKGAFTGADRKKDGLFVRADGDTLFLDEIGDISPELQRLLIRAIEEKRFYPIGAEKPVKSNFRLIAATNRPIREIRTRLDADFLDRIGQFTLKLPALRDIPEDVPWLWQTVLEEALRRAEATEAFQPLSSEDYERLLNMLLLHTLPGNIRDLFRVANALIAARVAIDSKMPPLPADDAIEMAISSLEDNDRSSEIDLSRKLAGSFARNARPDDLFAEVCKLKIKEHALRFSAYIADEALRYANDRGIDVNEWTDYTKRRLIDLRKERH